MKAVQLVDIGKPLVAREVPLPSLSAEDVLVRVRAAGICHSDVHYWHGLSSTGPKPHTMGHEVSGTIAAIGANVRSVAIGDRVALHYLVTCGECTPCRTANEQFCPGAKMIGKDIAGGYAEYIAVPARNAVPLPDEIPFEQGAIAMCSSATVFHALRKTRLQAGERVAVFGAGGLGMSAIQLARAFGAIEVYAVDIREERLTLAERLGAIPIDASTSDPVAELRGRCGGVAVSLELIGLPNVMRQAVRSLAPRGRTGIVGIADHPMEVDTYREVLATEAEIIGCSDHLLVELPTLLEFARQGRLDLASVVTRTVELDAGEINEVLHSLRDFGSGVRTVIRMDDEA